MKDLIDQLSAKIKRDAAAIARQQREIAKERSALKRMRRAFEYPTSGSSNNKKTG